MLDHLSAPTPTLAQAARASPKTTLGVAVPHQYTPGPPCADGRPVIWQSLAPTGSRPAFASFASRASFKDAF